MMKDLNALLTRALAHYSAEQAAFNYQGYLHAKDKDGNTLLHLVLQQLSDLNQVKKDTETNKKIKALLHILQDLNKLGFNYFMPNAAGITPYNILQNFQPIPVTVLFENQLYLNLTSLEPNDGTYMHPARAFEERCSKQGLPPADFTKKTNFENLQALINNTDSAIKIANFKAPLYKMHSDYPALSSFAVLASIGQFQTIQRLILAKKQVLNQETNMACAPVATQVDDDLINNIIQGKDLSGLATRRRMLNIWSLTTSQDAIIRVTKREKIAQVLKILDLNVDEPASNNQAKINAFIEALTQLSQTALIRYARVLPITPDSQKYIEDALRVMQPKDLTNVIDNESLFSDAQIDALNRLAYYVGFGVGYFEEYRPESKAALQQGM